MVGTNLQKAERMGDLIAAITRDGTECTNQHLLDAGFTPEEIDICGNHARAHAAIVLKSSDR